MPVRVVGAGKSTTMRLIVGLRDVADERVSSFSLAWANASIWPPRSSVTLRVLILDEPVNGLD